MEECGFTDWEILDLKNTMKTTIIIKGTHCNACKSLIEDVAKDVKGINSCVVDFANGKTEIEYDEDTNLQEFKKEIEKLGQYKIESSQ